jgi:uncharacterized protein YndB with AHSA1/START domain
MSLTTLGIWAIAVQGEDTAKETSRMEAEIEYTTHIAGTAKEVYQVFTTPKLASKVFPGPMRTFGKVGESVVWEWDGKEFANGKVITLSEDGTSLKHTFKFVGTEAGIDPDKEAYVTFAYTMREQNGVCSLHVTVSGFATNSKMKETLKWGVPYIMSGAKSVVETGKSIAEIAADKNKQKRANKAIESDKR